MGTVLVVDDEFGIADLIDAILSDVGHQVLMAANGQQGLEALARERVDLIFLDYMMPVMDGCSTLQTINGHAEFGKIPVVMMSSMLEASVAERCSGYAAFLRKPFRITDILKLAAQFMPAASA